MAVHVSWGEDAACRGMDPELFFPVGTTGAAVSQTEEVRRICCRCPVQTQCLAWALENGVSDGVWGGTTPDERRRVLRRLSGNPVIMRRPAPLTRALAQQAAEAMAVPRTLLRTRSRRGARGF
jgi:WhiB family transcriptional regulator, redox-sensing transcriptional regulator